jgi:hypothetical protein
MNHDVASKTKYSQGPRSGFLIKGHDAKSHSCNVSFLLESLYHEYHPLL